MYVVLVAILPILIVVLIVAIARIITVTVTVTVLITLLIVEQPLFAMLGTVSPPTVRTTTVVLFIAAFAIFAVLLIRGTVFLIRRR